MKLPVFYVLMLLIVGCNSKSPEKKTVNHNNEITLAISDKNLSNISFQVEGMTCEVGCAVRIEKKVAAMEGVATSKVDFEAKTAYVSFDPTTTSFDNVKTTIESLGDDYKVSEATDMPAFSSDYHGKKCAPACEKACCKKEGKDKMACEATCEKPCYAKKKEKA